MSTMDLIRRLHHVPYPTTVAPTYLIISREQFRLLATLPHFLAPLSVLGSLAIIHRILRFDRHGSDASARRTYYNLMLAMSVCDIIGSLAFALGSLPVPSTTLLAHAIGTTATCRAQGFFIHVFVTAVLYYNTGLMIYFVVTIRYGWTESFVAKRLEPVIHAWALLVPTAQAIVGLFLDIFNPIGFGNFCHISPYPLLCGIFDACTAGRSAKRLYTLFCTIPESILLGIIYVSIILIYCAVRGQARRALNIAANSDIIRARTRSVAFQSWLFAIVFFNTWVYAVMSPLLGYIFDLSDSTFAKAQYKLCLLSVTFLPLQGFFNFFIYIRPRFFRLWRDQQLSCCFALKLAVLGGQDSNILERRMPMQMEKNRNPRAVQTTATSSSPSTSRPAEVALPSQSLPSQSSPDMVDNGRNPRDTDADQSSLFQLSSTFVNDGREPLDPVMPEQSQDT